ncbi:MAG TPA: DNA ligase [Chromatiales bacterium]|nr:DNA ligase [Thiotrichales bacterium]HIP68956.1 DNA ligase [Chromatiales bacterium]
MDAICKSPRKLSIVLVIFVLLSFSAQADTVTPALTLAKIYHEGIDVSQYWVSEKLDGVRAYWDGEKLMSREGNVFAAPEWFIENFPAYPLDGELWLGRNQFEQLVSIVRKQMPVESEWRNVRYMVFELPDETDTFTKRYSLLKQRLTQLNNPYLNVIKQYRLKDHAALMKNLEEVVQAGAEGLMLHRADAPYQTTRTDDLLKVKPYFDAEARVIAYLPGKGKYRNMMGALLVETEEGKRFKIGTGFSDAERENPPPIGSVVTYKYHGLTRKGVPRFASFLRVRNDIQE